jgi:pyruvate/2-oxoglutarate dehydrogenase complex dihydrolipoamide dehydrogenase (E3) component
VRNSGERERLTTRSIVIATGGRPFVPPLPGLEEVGYLTSDTIWELRQLPRRLLVLGGGPIGCELTQAFARFGAQVTQVQQGPRIMVREDPEVSEMVTQRFRDEGISVLLNHQAKAFVVEDGEKILLAEHQGEEVRIPFDTLLVAVGRAANLQRLRPRGTGHRGQSDDRDQRLPANEIPEHLRRRRRRRALPVHPHGRAPGLVRGVNALFDPFKKFRTDYSVIPWATFVEPEVARVGLNETDARKRNIPYEVTRYGIDDLDRAIADGEAHGFIKVLTVPGKDRILGVTIVGEHGGDLIAEYVLAMRHGIGLNKILGTIHIYPTLAEANKYVAGNWKKAHAPQKLLAWVARFHAWRRG